MVLIKYILLFIIFLTGTAYAEVFSLEELRQLDLEKNYPKIINKIDNDLKSNSLDPTRLLSETSYSKDIQIKLYFKLKAYILGIQSGTVKPNDEQHKQSKQIIMMSDDFELDNYDFDDLIETFELETEKWEKSKFTLNYFVSISYLTWNHSLKLKDSNGEKANLYSKEIGPCFGGGIRYQNGYWGVESQLCYGYLSATVGEDSTVIKYNQSNVPVDAVVLTSNFLWKPKEQVAMKFGIPLVYHQADYEPSKEGKITAEETFSFGYFIGAEWIFQKYAVEISIGGIKQYPDSFWNFKLTYNFDT
ncbi:MAG: hypothetical protein ACJAS4_001485 [Bacteriovoracaceae bacterium]|jgi:hypothetical protein